MIFYMPWGRNLKVPRSDLPVFKTFAGPDINLAPILKADVEEWILWKFSMSLKALNLPDGMMKSNLKPGEEGWFALKNLLDSPSLIVV